MCHREPKHFELVFQVSESFLSTLREHTDKTKGFATLCELLKIGSKLNCLVLFRLKIVKKERQNKTKSTM